MKRSSMLQADYTNVHGFIKKLLEDARYAVARNVNAIMTACYWEFG